MLKKNELFKLTDECIFCSFKSMKKGTVIIFFCLLGITLFFSKGITAKSLSMSEQMPEHEFWGFDKTIFNDTERRNNFLKTFFNDDEVKKASTFHLCLLEDEIIKKNDLTKKFDSGRLKRVFESTCNTPSLDIPFFKHPRWKGPLYRSSDSKMMCRSKNNCAIIVEDANNKLVLGWLNHGLEVFKREQGENFVRTKEEYNLDEYLKKQCLDGLLDYKNTVGILAYSGGLGNQLFTYWSGVVYALKNNQEVYRLNKLYIDTFLDLPVKAVENQNKLSLATQPEFIKRYIKKGLGKCVSWHEISPESKCFEVSGYLQSWKNLRGYEDYIRDNMKFTHKPSKKSEEIIKKMEGENAVSVHVRRGDYVYSGYVLLNQDYYSKAIEYIKANVKNPVFYIFSNDQKWVKENIKIDAPHVYVDWTRKDYEDLELMSKCKHFINANSSFSWWGSFLSYNKNKIIIVPDKHTSWDTNWIQHLIAPNFVEIEVDKYYYDSSKKKFINE